eukprot:scaffold15725_cov24-Tisochrysis_lutea.AAC.1
MAKALWQRGSRGAHGAEQQEAPMSREKIKEFQQGVQAMQPPVYTVRVNPLRGITVEGLLARLAEEGVEACASSTLP